MVDLEGGGHYECHRDSRWVHHNHHRDSQLDCSDYLDLKKRRDHLCVDVDAV